MKKNIDWLKEEVEKMVEEADTRNLIGSEYTDEEVALEVVLGFIDQLDEPEVLSHEWIESNTSPVDDEGRLYVWKSDLQNLLVPKQEKVKIESVWAEDIEDAKASGMTLFKAMNWMAIDSDEKEKQDLFARAWLDGYTVGEQKYRVLDGNTTLLGRINGLMLTTVEILEYYPEYAPTFDLTEQEIKDYDPRYWPFAVKVEELEE